jgi:hypothetical protein
MTALPEKSASGNPVLYTSDPRGTVATEFESLAARIRSGELRGARIEWAQDLSFFTKVEIFSATLWDEISQEERGQITITRVEMKPPTRPMLEAPEPGLTAQLDQAATNPPAP